MVRAHEERVLAFFGVRRAPAAPCGATYALIKIDYAHDYPSPRIYFILRLEGAARPHPRAPEVERHSAHGRRR